MLPCDPQHLNNIEVLQTLDPEILANLAADSAWLRYHNEERIIDYLDDDDSVYFIVEGTVRVIIYSATGKAVAFREISSGGVFGEFAAIDGAARSASVESIGETIVARLPADKFCQLLDSEVAFAARMVRLLVVRLRELTTRVYEFSTLCVRNRIHAELLRLTAGAPRVDERVVISNITHADIASRISTHREAVSRELSRLAQKGILQREGGDIIVLDIERLTKMVSDATQE